MLLLGRGTATRMANLIGLVLVLILSPAASLVQIQVSSATSPVKTSSKGVALSPKDFLLGRSLGPYTVLRTVGRRPLMLDFHVDRLLQGRAHVSDASVDEAGDAEAAGLRERLMRIVEAGLECHPDAPDVMCTVLLDAVS